MYGIILTLEIAGESLILRKVAKQILYAGHSVGICLGAYSRRCEGSGGIGKQPYRYIDRINTHMSRHLGTITREYDAVAVDMADAGTVGSAITGHSIGKHYKLSASKRVGRRGKQIVGGSLGLFLCHLHIGCRAGLGFRLIEPDKS